jgi:hypothetical protein
MMALAVFGYFYTVKPAFQNQLLQEQAARLELEKRQAEESLSHLAARRKTVEAEIAAAQLDLARERAANSQLRAQTVAARDEAARAELAAKQLGDAERASASSLAASQLKLAVEQVRSQYYFGSLFSAMRRPEAEGAPELPQVPSKLLEAVAAVRERKDLRLIPNSMWDTIDSRIRAEQDLLVCSSAELNEVVAAHKAAMASAEQTVQSELAKELGRVEDEYARKGQKAVFSDRYRKVTENNFRTKYVWPLEQKFILDRSRIQSDCQDVGSSWLDTLLQ